jgi:hypothetical protein
MLQIKSWNTKNNCELERAADTRVHAKLGQLYEPDPGHVSNQIEQQQKIIKKTTSAKFRNIYLRNFAKIRNYQYCYEISRNFAK